MLTSQLRDVSHRMASKIALNYNDNIIYLMSWREVTVIFFDLRDLIPSKQA